MRRLRRRAETERLYLSQSRSVVDAPAHLRYRSDAVLPAAVMAPLTKMTRMPEPDAWVCRATTVSQAAASTSSDAVPRCESST